MVPPEAEAGPQLPSKKVRRRIHLFIAAFLALQFLLPLTYLLGDDPSDARFTWRGAPANTQPECEAAASRQHLDGSRETLEIDRLVHRDWVTYVERNRQAVVEAFLRKQCEEPGVLQVDLVNRCEGHSEDRDYSLRCGAGQVEVAERMTTP